VPELKSAINEFIECWNDSPRPFVWTASVESILEKMVKAKRTLEKIEPGCIGSKRKKKRKSA